MIAYMISLSVPSLFFQHAQKEAHDDICKSCAMRNHSLCTLWMKQRSSAHQVSFTHTPTSYCNCKANSDKKSASKNKPKKNKNNKAPCNKHSTQLLQKKAPYTSSKKTMNTLLQAASHNYVIVSLLIIQE